MVTQNELWVGTTKHLEIYEQHPEVRVEVYVTNG